MKNLQDITAAYTEEEYTSLAYLKRKVSELGEGQYEVRDSYNMAGALASVTVGKDKWRHLNSEGFILQRHQSNNLYCEIDQKNPLTIEMCDKIFNAFRGFMEFTAAF